MPYSPNFPNISKIIGKTGKVTGILPVRFRYNVSISINSLT